MEEKICINEYVRANDGRIFKVYKIDNKESRYKLYSDEYTRPINYSIQNHSFNIKELIEENDIVEYRINCISELKVGRVKKYRDTRNNKQYLGVEGYDIIKIYIETILTHEQYERNCYKVEEEQ